MNMEIVGDKLIITIDVSPAAIAKAPLSASKKNKTVATTNGFTTVPGTNIRVGMNVITKL